MGKRFEYAKGRVLDTLEFIMKEIIDYKNNFGILTYQEYTSLNGLKIKALERTIENILNALIELSGTISIERGFKVDNYYSALRKGARLVGVDEEKAEELAELANVRNNLVHRYLDTKWEIVREFQEKLPLITIFIKRVFEIEAKKY